MVTEPVFLFDSNICIYVLEGVGEPLRERIERQRPGEVVTSAIAYAEVMRGVDVMSTDMLQRIQHFFDLVAPLPFDTAAALRYRDLPFCRRSFDRLIAAHALSLNLTLVTDNQADFADITGLKVENWTL